MNHPHYLKLEFFNRLAHLQADTTPAWGVMNAQEMTEHLSLIFKVSSADMVFPIITKEEDLPKYIAFLKSDKLFRENTKAPVEIIGETPLPLHCENLADAVIKLKESVENFFAYFEKNPLERTAHPVFGLLTYDDWLVLHYKHAIHHLNQFQL